MQQGSFEGWTYFTRSNKKKIHMHISTVAGTIVYLSHPLKHLRHTQKTITMKHARKFCLTCPEGLWYLSVHIQITIQHDTLSESKTNLSQKDKKEGKLYLAWNAFKFLPRYMTTKRSHQQILAFELITWWNGKEKKEEEWQITPRLIHSWARTKWHHNDRISEAGRKGGRNPAGECVCCNADVCVVH